MAEPNPSPGNKKSSSAWGEDVQRLTVGSVWKGENESDPEHVESYDTNPLAEAGVWTEDEAYSIYREKLVQLRDLYIGQLSRLKHTLQERRRQFLLEWQAEGGSREQASIQVSQGGSLEDAAHRCYRKRSCEEALLERKKKRKRVAVSLELFARKEARDIDKAHLQYLMQLRQQLSPAPQPRCGTLGCDNHSLPFASRCLKHICDDPKQLLYTKCSYVYSSGEQCSNPIPLYIEPPLCGGHCDNAELSEHILERTFENSATQAGLEDGGRTAVTDIADTSQHQSEEREGNEEKGVCATVTLSSTVGVDKKISSAEASEERIQR